MVSFSEIKEVRKKKERAKELEGIDMSNIVTSSRRRSATSFVPPPKPKLPDESESDDSEDSEKEDEDSDDDNNEDNDNDEEEDNEESNDENQSEESNEGKSCFLLPLPIVVYTMSYQVSISARCWIWNF